MLFRGGVASVPKPSLACVGPIESSPEGAPQQQQQQQQHAGIVCWLRQVAYYPPIFVSWEFAC